MYVQGSEIRYADSTKQVPSRASKNRQARAGTNFSKPRTSLFSELCRSTADPAAADDEIHLYAGVLLIPLFPLFPLVEASKTNIPLFSSNGIFGSSILKIELKLL